MPLTVGGAWLEGGSISRYAGTWSATGSLNGVRNIHTATLLASGMVLGAGGVDQTGVNVLASAELFSSPADLAAQLVADSTGKGPGKALANEASGIQTATNARADGDRVRRHHRLPWPRQSADPERNSPLPKPTN